MRRAARKLTQGFGLIVVLGTVLPGCAALRAERTIEPASVRDAVQSRLGVTLAESSPVKTVATLSDVKATYVMKTSSERLLVVVFSTPAATKQFTGSSGSSIGDLLVIHNVVAVYEHDRRGISRLEQLRSALRGLRPATG